MGHLAVTQIVKSVKDEDSLPRFLPSCFGTESSTMSHFYTHSNTHGRTNHGYQNQYSEIEHRDQSNMSLIHNKDASHLPMTTATRQGPRAPVQTPTTEPAATTTTPYE